MYYLPLYFFSHKPIVSTPKLKSKLQSCISYLFLIVTSCDLIRAHLFNVCVYCLVFHSAFIVRRDEIVFVFIHINTFFLNFVIIDVFDEIFFLSYCFYVSVFIFVIVPLLSLKIAKFPVFFQFFYKQQDSINSNIHFLLLILE
jgi:hypothetical protein